MRVDIIDRMQAFAALRANWEAVYDADPEAQFFLSWTFLNDHLPTHADRWFVLAARRDETSDYVAFLPLRRRTIERKGGGFINDINMAGNYAADYAGLICVPEVEAQAIPALASHLRQMNWRQLRFENVMISAHRFDLFMSRFPKKDFEFKPIAWRNADNIDNSICPYATLPGDWDQYLDTKLSANTRQKIRRLMRQLDRSDEFKITHATAETLERDLDILFRFWSEKWGARKGKRLASIIASMGRLIRKACAAGTLFMPVLWQGDRPLGVLVSFVDDRKKAFLFLIGARDETFNSPPPGVILHAHSIRHAIANGITTYDFLRGNESYKYSFGVEERQLRSVHVRTKDGKNLGDKLDPKSLAVVFRRATELHKQNELVAAERAYRQVLQTNPDSKGALYGLAQLVGKRGDHFAAKRLLRRLVTVDPSSFKGWFRLGRTLVARGELSEAAHAYCEVIEREPKFLNAYADLAQVLLRLGLPGLAVTAYEAVLGLKHDYPDAEAGLMKALRARSELPGGQPGRKARQNADVIERVTALTAVASAVERYHRREDANRIVAKGVLIPRDLPAADPMPTGSPAPLPN